jgi:hypothetical protein
MGMFNQTDFDLRHADYIARTARVNRDGWMTEDIASLGTLHDQGRGPFIERTRRSFGDALIAVGERMKGTTADHVSTPATTGYGHAS